MSVCSDKTLSIINHMKAFTIYWECVRPVCQHRFSYSAFQSIKWITVEMFFCCFGGRSWHMLKCGKRRRRWCRRQDEPISILFHITRISELIYYFRHTTARPWMHAANAQKFTLTYFIRLRCLVHCFSFVASSVCVQHSIGRERTLWGLFVCHRQHHSGIIRR